ncbi:hypothetical protein [Brucella pituitosa]|uniref:DUF3757 domain-containing protein n=1 Tax=Brucella pituitosa TaxID=571256 RepID=A0ABS3K149_9HYPH|nr:hypothetical protein [Brucella pituitosa]MBO1040645.1 hypothetical protein [Brucella pituitosa]
MLGKAFHIVRVAAIAAGVMATGAAAAETPNRPDWGVKAISKLSDSDLVITSPAGKAFMDKLAPDHDKACGKPDENRPDFDEYCSWAFNNEEADFDILLGIKDNKIVSVVASTVPENNDVWVCEKTQKDIPESDLQTCNVRSADEKSRTHWSESWESFLNSIN